MKEHSMRKVAIVIAHMLGISSSTVKAHNCKTLRSLGLLRRGQLARYVIESGQFDPETAEQQLFDRHARNRSIRP